MNHKRSSQESVADEEKRNAINEAIRKIASRLGVNPDLIGEKIGWSPDSGNLPDREHNLAMAKGLQIGFNAGSQSLEELFPSIRTQEDLDRLVRTFDEVVEQSPTIARKLMDQIRSTLPRRGGPGRDSKLNAEESAKVCDQIAKFHREGFSITESISKTSSLCPELLGKSCGTRTLSKAWNRRNELNHETLPPAMQIRLKRRFIRVEVVRKESDQRLRYHMFKRLNTGGENLSEQEIRNCTVRLLEGGAAFMAFLSELAQSTDFVLCTDTLTDEARQQRTDEELVLRFFAFKKNRAAYKHDVGDFMTEYMESVADPQKAVPFDYATESAAFVATFQILARTLDDRSFGWVNNSGTIVRGFSVYHYEAFTLGLQRFLPNINVNDSLQLDAFRNRFEEIKRNKQFQQITGGGGRNSRGALDRRISFVEEALQSLI